MSDWTLKKLHYYDLPDCTEQQQQMRFFSPSRENSTLKTNKGHIVEATC